VAVALIYQATLNPTKIELLTAWVPSQPWLGEVDASNLEPLGAYRFDDPDGQVGIETHLLRTPGGRILQVPLTYRDAPLAGGERSLITTTQHSVLGRRWVYDAVGDPVYAQALATTILAGGTQADLDFVTDAGLERREATTLVSSLDSPASDVPSIGPVTHSVEATTSVLRGSGLELIVFRHIDPDIPPPEPGGEPRLVGTWPGRDTPVLLALAPGHTTHR
jgi:hypothetical protein